MIFGPVNYLNYKEPYKIQIDGHCIVETKVLKFLGIYVDCKLTFKDHVNYVSNKLSVSIGAMNRAKFFLPRSCLNMVYHSVCLPHLVYGNIIWGSTYSSITYPLQIMIKRAMRIIGRTNLHEPYKELFMKSNNLDFYCLHRYICGIFVYKQFSNLLPKLFDSYYRYENILRYKNLIISNKSRTNIIHFHIICNGPIIWNDLIRNSNLNHLLNLGLECFKKKIKKILICKIT